MHSCGTSPVSFEALEQENLNFARFDRRIIKIFVAFSILVAVKELNVLFSPTRDWHGDHHSHCTCMVNVRRRCVWVCVCVCERASLTQKSRCIIINCTPYTHRTHYYTAHTACFHTLNKCSCVCKWLYGVRLTSSTSFFRFSFSSFHPRVVCVFVCRVVVISIVCFFMHGIFSCSLRFWLVECSIFISVHLSTLLLPSNTTRVYCVCVYSVYTSQSVAIVLALVLLSGFARWLLT